MLDPAREVSCIGTKRAAGRAAIDNLSKVAFEITRHHRTTPGGGVYDSIRLVLVGWAVEEAPIR